MAVSLVLGLGLEHSCPWPREALPSESLSSLASASDFLCPWPWPRSLCPRLHLWYSHAAVVAIPQLWREERKRPTPVRKRFSAVPRSVLGAVADLGGGMGGMHPPHQPKSNDFGRKISFYFE